MSDEAIPPESPAATDGHGDDVPGHPRARVEVLGPLRVLTPRGEEATVPRGKNTALLAYLAAETHGVDRETLEGTFWPDATPRARRQSLRQALSTLRKALECDPFIVGERVRLDRDLCDSDFDDFRQALWTHDGERCLALFRGPPFTDVSPRISVEFAHWLDRRREAALQRLGAVARSMGRQALEDGNEEEAQRIVGLGVRGGLSEDATRAEIYGALTDRPSWAAATVGPPGLETLTFRARPGLDSLVALVVEDDEEWAHDTLAAQIEGLPTEGRPALVRVPARAHGPETVIVGLLRALVTLPGGAAVRQTTLDVMDELAHTPGALDDDRTRASTETALADALDATLEEQALVLTSPAAGLRLLPATILGRALALQGGEGATLVVHGASERELGGLPVQALVDACRELRHVRQSTAGAPLAFFPAKAMLTELVRR